MRLLQLGLILSLATAGYADIITLKSGRVINGTYLGGSAREVKVEVADQIETYDINQVAKIEFGNGRVTSSARDDRPTLRRADTSDSDSGRPTLRRDTAPPPPQPQTAAASDDEDRPILRRGEQRGENATILRPGASDASAASTASSVSTPHTAVELPAGTNLLIRMIDGVDSEKNTVGQTFHATVDQAVTVAGQSVIPRGADAVVKLVDSKESGKLSGRSELTLALVSVRVDDRMVDVNTQTIKEQSDARGQKTAKMAGGGAVAGAIIGAIAGGGKGAAAGAAAGGAAGAGVEAISKGPRVRIPSETRLMFVLDNPVTI